MGEGGLTVGRIPRGMVRVGEAKGEGIVFENEKGKYFHQI